MFYGRVVFTKVIRKAGVGALVSAVILATAPAMLGQERNFRETPVGKAAYDEAVERALARHPGLAAALARWHAAEDRVSSVRSWPDPKLAFQIMNPLKLEGPQLSITQSLLAGRKYEVAADVATAEVAMARADYLEQVAMVRRAVIRNLAEAAYLANAFRLTERTQLRDRATLELATARYAVGKTAQSELLSAQMRLGWDRHDIAMLKRELAHVDADLLALQIAPDSKSLPALRPVGASPAALMKLAHDHSPTISRLRAELELAAGQQAARPWQGSSTCRMT